MLRGAVFGKQMLDNGANHQAHRKNWLQAERDLRGTRRPSSRRRGRLLLLVILNNLIGWIAGRSDEPNIVIPLGRGLLYAEPIYLQAERSPMPELRIVVLALQDRLA